MKGLNYFIAFLSGAVVGAAAGLLFAPEKGSDLRARIAEALHKRGIHLNKDELNALVQEISEEITNNPDEEEEQA